MKKIKGGRAHLNGVSIYGEDKMARVIFDKNEGYKIYSANYKSNNDKSIINKLSEIPFIRAYVFLYKLVRNNLKLFYYTLAIYISTIAFLVLIGQENVDVVEGVVDTFYSSEIIFVLVFLVVFKLLPISNYHGAEHMVINAYMSKQKETITLNELSETSRASDSCGSALVLIFILVRSLFFWVPMESLWVSLISYSIAYEIFMGKSDYFDFVFLLSGFIQNIFLTSVPNKEQLKAAIIAIERATDEKLVEDSHQL